MAQFTEQDRILLNNYIDGRLDAAERAEFEARLAADFALRTELEQLRETVGLLRMAERVPVPRNFTLDPKVYGKPEPRSLWERLGLANIPGWAVATASLVVVVICLGVLIVNGGFGGMATPASVAEAPAPFLAAQQAPAATEAAMTEAMTEAPAPTEAMTEETYATEAGTEAPFAAEMATEAPAAAAPETTSGKSASSVPPNDMTPPMGMGGGPEGGAAGGGPGNGSSMQATSLPPAPLATRAIESGPAPTQAAASGEGLLSQGNAADTARSSASAVTEEPYATIEVTEAPVFQGLEPGSWMILLGGTLGLIVVVLGVTFLMRRRQ